MDFVLLEFSRSDSHFLLWALAYIEGGFGGENETQRQHVTYRITEALGFLEVDEVEDLRTSIDETQFISIIFPLAEIQFLEWAMRFLWGGVGDEQDELTRQTLEARFRKALDGLSSNIWQVHGSELLLITCAFCGGTGKYPEELTNLEVVFEPCPVCVGKGFSTFKTTKDNILTCRFCDGDGKAWDRDGQLTGEVCSVCHGLGKVFITPLGNENVEWAFWDLIHPIIVNVSRNRFESGKYADAVEAALKEVNSTVKRIVIAEVGIELDGSKLMHKAFSPEKPIIRLGDINTESGRNRQKGFMDLFVGSMIGVRNPVAHDNLEIDRLEAIHCFFLASLLFLQLESHSY